MPSKKYRSVFEATIAKANPDLSYETTKLTYVVPAKSHKYTPDFILSNGIIVETKGFLPPADRKKMIFVRDQHPDLDIRIVFMRAANKLNKNSKTTYGAWATKNGFTWAEGSIPQAWRDEKVEAEKEEGAD